jgi:hypothetical protein
MMLHLTQEKSAAAAAAAAVAKFPATYAQCPMPSHTQQQ